MLSIIRFFRSVFSVGGGPYRQTYLVGMERQQGSRAAVV